MADFLTETQRLIIRRFDAGDGQDLYEYLSQEAVVRFEPYDVYTLPEAEAEAKRRAGDNDFWAVCLKPGGKVIGNIYLAQQEPQEIRTWELGYVFNAAYWGKGYASEACMAIMEYAFDTLRAHRIVAMCNPKNVASWKLLERLNFRREGHQVKNMYFKTDSQGAPIWSDTYMYAMLSVEYLLRRYHEI